MRPRSLTVDPRVVDYATDLQSILLAQRTDTPRAANGRPIALGDRYAEQVMKEMRQGRSAEVQRVVAVLVALARVGETRPVEMTLRYLASVCHAEAVVADTSSSRRRRAREASRPLDLLLRDEERANGPLNLVQLELSADPTNPQTLHRAWRACTSQIRATKALGRAIVRALVRAKSEAGAELPETTTPAELGRLASGVDHRRSNDWGTRRGLTVRSHVRPIGATPPTGGAA